VRRGDAIKVTFPFLPQHRRSLKIMAKSEQAIVIKKYSNRRLYNTGTLPM
jgi:hypothetical protein